MRHDTCSCQKEGLVLTFRQISGLTAFLLVGMLFVFAAGYFWGKKAATQEFMDEVLQECLTDQVNSSLYIGEYNQSSEEEPATQESVAYEQKATQAVEQVVLATQSVVAPVVVASAEVVHAHVQDASDNKVQKASKQYKARLISYNTRAEAQRFVDKAALHGWNLVIEERASSAARNKKIKWYQVTTMPLDSYKKTETLKKEIEHKMNLSGTLTVTC